MNPIDIVSRFRTKKLDDKLKAKVERHLNKGRELAELINAQCPDNREKALAITKIEEAIMWANKSVSREGK